jgi:3-phosphoshikimate 1-carboxyvinyltransferase
MEYSPQFGVEVETTYTSSVTVAHWPNSGWQIDERFSRVVDLMGLGFDRAELDQQRRDLYAQYLSDGAISRARNLGDSIMTAIVIAPTLESMDPETPLRFTDLGRLRLQECERVAALKAELTQCGARVIERGDALEVFPSALHGAEIETYNDHRMAMCFAILGLKVPGIKIKNPVCVKKTFPNFFQKLATPAPRGVGARILDGQSGQPLGLTDLFAD